MTPDLTLARATRLRRTVARWALASACFTRPPLPHLPARLRPLLLGATLLCAAAGAQAPGDIRVALVIGNAAYTGAPALANPVNDARAMSETLKSLGFSVLELRDGNKAQMAEAIERVRSSLRGKQGVGLFYYAGHGLQVDLRNYMVPVDARLSGAADVPKQTVDVGAVIDAFKAAGNRMNIVVLDACRDNPFGKDLASGKGLAPVDAPSGTFLAYATAPGNVAEDGDDKSGNGLYTQYLLQELKKPQSRIEDVFKRVRFGVRKASNGRQIPWESTSLEEDFQFNDGRVVAAAKPTGPQLQAEFSQEKQDWDRIKDSRNPDDFYAFVQKYPSGVITESAHARLNQLTRVGMVVQGAGADGKDQAYTLTKFRLGDVYELRSHNGAPGARAMTIVYRVTKVEADRVEVMMEYPGQNIPPTPQVYDAAGALVSVGEISRYDPPQSYVPGGLLQVGQSWKAGYQVTWGRQMNLPPRTLTIEGRIVAREQVELPAGRFNAFRFETRNRAFDSRGEQPGTDTTVWMVPEVPFPIKVDTLIEVNGQKMRSVLELVRMTRGA
jgi:hypothetical protein